jgi:hypothetical protein
VSAYYHIDELAASFTASLADANILDRLTEDKAAFLQPRMNNALDLSSLMKDVFAGYQHNRSFKIMTMILPVSTSFGRIILFCASSLDAHISSITHPFDFQAMLSLGFAGCMRDLQTKLLV